MCNRAFRFRHNINASEMCRFEESTLLDVRVDYSEGAINRNYEFAIRRLMGHMAASQDSVAF